MYTPETLREISKTAAAHCESAHQEYLDTYGEEEREALHARTLLLCRTDWAPFDAQRRARG